MRADGTPGRWSLPAVLLVVLLAAGPAVHAQEPGESGRSEEPRPSEKAGRSPQAAQQGQVTAPTRAMDPPDQVTIPEALEDPELTLADAVSLSLQYDPIIALSRQDLALALGIEQEASGVFDAVGAIRPGYSFIQQELQPFLRQREEDRRLVFERLRDGATELVEIITPRVNELNNMGIDGLDDLSNLRLPPCPTGFQEVSAQLQGFSTNVLLGSDQAGRSDLEFGDAFAPPPGSGTISNDLNDLLAICDPRVSRRNNTAGLVKRLNDILETDFDFDDEIFDAFNAARDILNLQRELGQLIAVKSGLALERAGGIPKDERTKTVSLELGYLKPFRSGLAFSFDVRLQATERNFKGKPLDPSFGGMGVRNQFPNSVSLTFDMPLGKGRGSVSAAAPERAAGASVAARRQSLRHTVSQEVFRTVLSYLSLAAAQESLQLLEESAARQEQIAAATEDLVTAGQIVGAERDRAQARAATVQRAVAGGQLTVLQARLSLAETMGVDVDELSQAPIAAEGLPEELVDLGAMGALLDRAVERRRDLRAASRTRDAQEILTDAARADLKRNFDFSITAGYNTLYESPFFRFFPDEQDPTESPVRGTSARGVFRSFDGNWEPFVMASLTIDFPFANNRAEGQFVQRRASLTRSRINLANLERIIQDNVVDVRGSLDRAAQVVQRRQEAVQFQEEILGSTLELFDAGNVSLLDVLVTEQDLTTARLDLVQALQTYWSLVARLGFESGDLVNFADEGQASEAARFVPADVWGSR